jgi:hypothetical protein
MRKSTHSPAYALQIGRDWRIVVPIRGKLSAKTCARPFETRAEAEAWLRSRDGQATVALLRGERAPDAAETTPLPDYALAL